MKECVECGKKLGIIESYRHPTMGRDNLLCSDCFDTVSISVEKWSKFILPYVDFFSKESQTIGDIKKTDKNITKNIKNVQNKIRNIVTLKSN
jgi:hypothetical protein